MICETCEAEPPRREHGRDSYSKADREGHQGIALDCSGTQPLYTNNFHILYNTAY